MKKWYSLTKYRLDMYGEARVFVHAANQKEALRITREKRGGGTWRGSGSAASLEELRELIRGGSDDPTLIASIERTEVLSRVEEAVR